MTDLNTPLPIYGTQGGGYATWSSELQCYVWHSEIPDFMSDAKVGDPIPKEWDLIPANQAARDDMFGDDDFDDVTLGDYGDPEWTDDGIPPPFSIVDSL